MATRQYMPCRQPLSPPAACASPRMRRAPRDTKKVEAGPHVATIATSAAPCRKATALAALKSTRRSSSLKALSLPPAAAVCSPRGSLPGALHGSWVGGGASHRCFARHPGCCAQLSPHAPWMTAADPSDCSPAQPRSARCPAVAQAAAGCTSRSAACFMLLPLLEWQSAGTDRGPGLAFTHGCLT